MPEHSKYERIKLLNKPRCAYRQKISNLPTRLLLFCSFDGTIIICISAKKENIADILKEAAEL